MENYKATITFWHSSFAKIEIPVNIEAMTNGKALDAAEEFMDMLFNYNPEMTAEVKVEKIIEDYYGGDPTYMEVKREWVK